MGKRLERFGEARIVDEIGLWTGHCREDRVDFGAPPQTEKQYSKEGRICNLYIFRR